MSGYNIAASNYGMFPNLYNNQIALNDLSGLDMYLPTGMTMDPMLTMNGSIFNGFGGFPMSGGYPMMGMPFMGGGNYEEYYKNYEKYQDFMINQQIRQQQKMRNADLQLNSPQEGIVKQAKIVHEKIMLNEQQQILKAYQSFKDSVKRMYPDASEAQIADRASTLYQQITGTGVTDDIRKHGRGSFTQGLYQTLTFGLADSKTAEENISALTGQPVGRSEKIKKFAGNVVGGAAVGGTAFLAAKPLLNCLKIAGKAKTFWGVVIGAGIGLISAIAGSK